MYIKTDGAVLESPAGWLIRGRTTASWRLCYIRQYGLPVPNQSIYGGFLKFRISNVTALAKSSSMTRLDDNSGLIPPQGPGKNTSMTCEGQEVFVLTVLVWFNTKELDITNSCMVSNLGSDGLETTSTWDSFIPTDHLQSQEVVRTRQFLNPPVISCLK